MSALQILLNDLVNGVWPVVPAPSAPWWLTLDDEVVIALFEDEASASILLCASPGYLPAEHWRQSKHTNWLSRGR